MGLAATEAGLRARLSRAGKMCVAKLRGRGVPLPHKPTERLMPIEINRIWYLTFKQSVI